MDRNTPLPSEAAKTTAEMPSRMAFAMSMDGSPDRPSCIEPTIAIAPMQMSSEKLTKPSTKWLSPWLFSLS